MNAPTTLSHQFYQKLSPEEARPYLGVLLGQQEISLESDIDGCGTIKVHDKTADIVWEARNRFIPNVFDGKKLYHDPFETCDIVTSLRLLEYFFSGERPKFVTAWFGDFYDCRRTDPDHPQMFVAGRPNESEAIMFALTPRDTTRPLNVLEERQDDLLWRSSSIQNLGPLVKGDIIDYYVFQMPTDPAWQSELQEQTFQQAQLTNAAFKEWSERMKQLDARRQEIMELEFIFNQFEFKLLKCGDPTKLCFALENGLHRDFDLEVDTKETALTFLRNWYDQRDA